MDFYPRLTLLVEALLDIPCTDCSCFLEVHAKICPIQYYYRKHEYLAQFHSEDGKPCEHLYYVVEVSRRLLFIIPVLTMTHYTSLSSQARAVTLAL